MASRPSAMALSALVIAESSVLMASSGRREKRLRAAWKRYSDP